MPKCPPPAEARPAVLDALRILAALDPDKARLRNGAGFSAADSSRGRALASKRSLFPDEALEGLEIIERYRRQIPADLMRKARWTPPQTTTSLSDALDAIIAMRPRAS